MEWLKHLPIGKTLMYFEGHFMLATLKAHNGNRTQAAKALGLSAKTLRRKLEAFVIQYPDNEIPLPLLGIENHHRLKKSITPCAGDA